MVHSIVPMLSIQGLPPPIALQPSSIPCFFFLDFIIPNDDIVLPYDSKCVVNISLFTFGLVNVIRLMFGLQVGLSPQGDVMFNPYFIKF
jgi:hypothetical protein